MKKIFLSLLTVFMVLSLSVVLVKAEGETSVALTDGVQIRTDGKNGLRWEATVTDPAAGDSYGFLFAQGEYTVDNFPKDTAIDSADTQVISELKEDGTFAATMTNFPKAAAVKDISVLAYVKNGETVTYSTNVVVRNLSEVAIEAYEVKGITTGFAQTVYNASQTTFDVGDGYLKGDYSFTVTSYSSDTGGNYIGIESVNNKNTAMGIWWYRIAVKYDESVKAYKVVGVQTEDGKSFSVSDYDYLIGAFNKGLDQTAVKQVKEIVALGEEANNLYVNFTLPEETGYCSLEMNFFYDIELLNYTDHIGGGEKLPEVYKEYYDFVGWYNNNEFSGTPVNYQGKDRKLFAGFTPTKYTITWDLSGGSTTATLVENYTIESETITVPTSDTMSMEGATFNGWLDDEGNSITEIPTGSTGDIKITAQWVLDKTTSLEISDVDTNALNALYNENESVATILVNSEITSAAKYILTNTTLNENYANVEYEYGVNLFSSLSDAASFAEENAIIYIFAGSYSDASTISVANVTIAGPNYNVPFSQTRNNEANVSGNIVTNKDGLVLNGIQLSGSAKINYTASLSGAEIRYVLLTTTSFNAVLGDTSMTISNFVMDNCKLNNTSSSTSYGYRPIRFSGTLKNAVITNNYFSYGIGNKTLVDTFYINAMSGTIDIINNNFAQCISTNYLINVVTAANATKVRINGNSINGVDATNSAAGIYIKTTSANTAIELIGNEFNYVAGNLFRTDGLGPITIKYNQFLNTSVKMTITSTTQVTFGYNYFYTGNATTNTVLTDNNPYDTAANCKAAYEASLSE